MPGEDFYSSHLTVSTWDSGIAQNRSREFLEFTQIVQKIRANSHNSRQGLRSVISILFALKRNSPSKINSVGELCSDHDGQCRGENV